MPSSLPVTASAHLSSRGQLHSQVGSEVVAAVPRFSSLCPEGIPLKVSLKGWETFPHSPSELCLLFHWPSWVMCAFLTNRWRRDGVMWGGLGQPGPTPEMEPLHGRAGKDLVEVTILLATDALFSLLEGGRHFQFGRIVGLMLQMPCVILHNSGARWPKWQNWTYQH